MRRCLIPLLLQTVEGVQDQAGVPDGVNAQLGLRAMGSTAGQFELESGESTVRGGQYEATRLGHQGGVGANAAQHLFGSDAAEFFVGDQRHDHVPG